MPSQMAVPDDQRPPGMAFLSNTTGVKPFSTAYLAETIPPGPAPNIATRFVFIVGLTRSFIVILYVCIFLVAVFFFSSSSISFIFIIIDFCSLFCSFFF
jgi:hypothetical protein